MFPHLCNHGHYSQSCPSLLGSGAAALNTQQRLTYTAHLTLHTHHCTLNTAPLTLHNQHSILNTAHLVLHTSVNTKNHNANCTMQNTPNTTKQTGKPTDQVSPPHTAHYKSPFTIYWMSKGHCTADCSLKGTQAITAGKAT